MKKLAVIIWLLLVGISYGSIWDCVKPAPQAQVLQASSVSDIWSVVKLEIPATPIPVPEIPVPATPVVTDADIVNAISAELEKQLGEGFEIRVECKDGVVTFTGTTKDDQQSKKATWIATSAAGVKNVTNKIVVAAKKEETVKATAPVQYYNRRRSGSCSSGACTNGSCR